MKELAIALISGVVGGLFGGLSALLASYFAPKWLEEARQNKEEQRIWGPRKALIKEMLDRAAPDRGRTFKTLKRVTGTPDDDLRRLLVELGARGFTRDKGTDWAEEAWAYTWDRPLRNH